MGILGAWSSLPSFILLQLWKKWLFSTERKTRSAIGAWNSPAFLECLTNQPTYKQMVYGEITHFNWASLSFEKPKAGIPNLFFLFFYLSFLNLCSPGCLAAQPRGAWPVRGSPTCSRRSRMSSPSSTRRCTRLMVLDKIFFLACQLCR